MHSTTLLTQYGATIVHDSALVVLQRFQAAELLVLAILMCAEECWLWDHCT